MRLSARRRIGRLLLAVALVAAALSGGRAVLSSSWGRDRLLDARLSWTRLFHPGRPAAVRPLFHRTLMAALQAAGADTSLIRADWTRVPAGGAVPQGAPGSPTPGSSGAAAWRGRWEVPLPEGFGPTRGNVVVTTVVERFGGAILDGVEQPGNQLLLTAQVPPGLGLEALLIGKRKPRGGAPRLALLVDRFGFRNLAESEALMEMGRDLSVAVLPYTTGARDLADRCRSHGMEVLLNLPMEGLDYPRVDPGPGAVLVDLSPGEIRRRVQAALDEIGGAAGMHTFLGALAVEDRQVMRAVMEIAAARGVYFVDSAPSSYSVARETAAEVGVPSIRLSDNLDAPAAGAQAVRRNLEALASQARAGGVAVGLIHPYPGTVRALETLLPEWRRTGIELVPLSEIVRVPEE